MCVLPLIYIDSSTDRREKVKSVHVLSGSECRPFCFFIFLFYLFILYLALLGVISNIDLSNPTRVCIIWIVTQNKISEITISQKP